MTRAMTRITIESPLAGQHLHDQAITVAGWIAGSKPAGAVRVWCDDQLVGETEITVADGEHCAFRLLGRLGTPIACETPVTLRVSAADGAAEVPVVLVPARLHERPYGEV